MKTPRLTPVTRMFPIGTAAHHSRLLASILAGSGLLGGSAMALDNPWTGAVDNNWNNPANWSDPHNFGSLHVPVKGAPHPDDEDALINTLTNFPVITALTGPLPVPRDIKVGVGGGPGRLDVRAGTAAAGSGNWVFAGTGGNGSGTINVADTSAAGGTLTGFAQGSGNLNSGDRLYVGGVFGSGSGTVNINTTGVVRIPGRVYIGTEAGSTGTINLDSGTLNVGNDLVIGDGNGTGRFNMSAGTVTTGGWNFCGRGSTGFMNIDGGSLTNTGRFYFGENGNGTAVQTGGTVSSASEVWIGQGATGVGSYSISGGTMSVGGWFAIGREGGQGTLNISGSGTVVKNGGDATIVGSDAVGGTGTITQTGGTLTVNGGELRIGAFSGAAGTWNMSAGSATLAATVKVGDTGAGTLNLSGGSIVANGGVRVGETGSGAGTLGLNGGSLTTNKLSGGGGTDVTTFNGTQLIANSPATPFIEGLDAPTIDAGGLLVNTNGFNAVSVQVLTGTGGVTKSGAGTLTLTGASSYTGTETVSAGTLLIGTDNTNAPNVNVANGAGFGVQQVLADSIASRNNVTFGTTGASSATFDLGNFAGNTATAPLNVAGVLRLNSTVTVNITDQLPETGIIPLISYTGPKQGTGTFVLGSLPNGVVATLVDNGTNQVSLNVTSVALPYWDATLNNIWDTTTSNWINQVGGASITYKNGNPVLFDDLVDGPGGGADLVLNSIVTPASVIFRNSVQTYSLNGTGKISGAAGLLKQGTNPLTISNINDYTGVTRLEGGTTLVPILTNGGAASPLGAAPAAAANLVLGGGTLEYTGPATTTDRGITVAGANSGLATANNLTLSGPIITTGGNLIKAGAGDLTLTNAVLALGTANPAMRVAGGTLTLDGAGAQTVSTGSDLVVGNLPDVPASLALKSTALTVGGWISVGRGNGSSGTLSSLTATNSSITTVNFSTGYDAGLGGNDNDQTISLTNSNWTTNGPTLIAESLNTTTNMTIGGTSHYQANDRFLMGLGTGSVVNLTIENSGSLTKTGGWLAIGNSNNGIATVTVKDSGSLSANGDFNIGDVDTSTGFLNIEGNATVTSTDIAFIGKNGGTNGTINQTGGTFNGNSWISVGRYSGGTGKVNVSGGTFNQNGTGQRLIIGEEGAGTVTLSGTGAINALGDSIVISNNATAAGILNLDGGTLTVRRIVEGAANAGSGTVNFNGGLLKAGTGANPDFLNGLDAANVLAGGARIDTNGNNITIGQALLDTASTGGLTKTGAGTLLLNGASTYTGTTTLTTGTLGGTGAIAGPLVVSAGTTLVPGAAASAGTFSVGGATTVSGTYACELDGPLTDTLAVTNTLNVSAATLAITTLAGGANEPAYVIASYTGATPAPFAAVTGLPPGYSVNYAYNNGVASTNIALVSSAVPAAYTAWISGFYPGETNPAIIGPASDPDKDGQSNSMEFTLGGAPNSGSNNAKTYLLAADGDGDGDTTRELLTTIAVRLGTPAFSGNPSPTAIFEGFIVTVEGGTSLNAFPNAVNPVGVVSTGLPTAPAGYEYRTFSLAGSNGLPAKGFLRVRVAP
jgi:autotransporter-associated beta strand protein